MNKNLIQRIAIGVLAASTIAVSVAMAVVLNTYVTVTLRAGEGSFKNNRQDIVLQNVRPGSTLKTISGYALPSKNDDNYTFDNWIDDSKDHKIVKQNAKVGRNMVLVASYTYSAKYYREKYIQDIKNEAKDSMDYAINKQLEHPSKFPSSIETVANIGIKALNDSKSSFNIGKIYDFIHDALKRLNRFDVVRDNSGDFTNYSYDYITNVCKEDINYFQDNYTNEQLEIIDILSKNHLSTNYLVPTDKNLTKDVYQEAVTRLTKSTKPYDLHVIKSINAGLIRGSTYLADKSELQTVTEVVEGKLEKAKKDIKDDTKLEKMIDFLGDYAATYCKCLYLENPKELIAKLNSLCDQMFNLLINGDKFAEQKISMISALIEGNSYDMTASQMDIINSEDALIKYIFTQYTTEKQINDITEIVLSAANTLKGASKYATNCIPFIEESLHIAISSYDTREDFLDCAIYAMSVPSNFENIPLTDMYIKEWENVAYPTTYSFIDYQRVSATLQKAFNFYNDKMSSGQPIPEKNLESFKILIKGIIDTSAYSKMNDYNATTEALNDFIGTIEDCLGIDLFLYKQNASALTGLAYAMSGLAFAYVKSYNQNSTLMDNDLLCQKIKRTFLDDYVFDKWYNAMSDKCIDDASSLIGETIYLNWKYNFFYFLIPPYQQGTEHFDEGFNDAYNNNQNWFTTVVDCIQMSRNDQALLVLENALTQTLNSNRLYHYSINHEDWANYEAYNKKNSPIIKDLFNTILSSETTTQFIKRLDIYTKEFIDVINRMNNTNTFNNPDITKLKENTEADMKRV